MGLLQRIRRFWRAHFHSRDETEAEIQTLLMQIDEQLAEARGELIYCSGEEGRLTSKCDAEKQTAQQMLTLARQAMQSGQRELVREAITRHLRATHHAQQYERLCLQQHDGVRRLAALVEQLEMQHADLCQRQNQLQLRRHLARTRRTLLNTIYGAHSRVPVERVEEDTLQEELMTDAYQQLAEESTLFPQQLADGGISDEAIEAVIRQLRGEMSQAALPDEHEG